MPIRPTYPGVYVVENSDPGGSQPITGVPTSVAAFLGRAASGPVGKATTVSSSAEYQSAFGGLAEGSPMSFAVRNFFDNGGAEAVVVRLLAEEPVSGGAADGVGGPVRDLYVGDREARTGMYALDGAMFNILCVPPDDLSQPDGGVPVAFWKAAAVYCGQRRAMLIAEPPQSWAEHAVAGEWDKIQASDLGMDGDEGRNAAVYFPRAVVADPLNGGADRLVSACGMIAGIWAATDTKRGVWKAPAGMEARLAGVSRLEVSIGDAQNGMLNALGINCLRSFPAIGPVVWGDRTLRGADALADDFKYISVRRLLLYIEESVRLGIQWAVFEPNDEALWSELRLAVGTFLQGLFLQGGLAGSTAGWFVNCDTSTTTQSDVDHGIVNIVIGVAPLKPAEFVVIQISQIVLPCPNC